MPYTLNSCCCVVRKNLPDTIAPSHNVRELRTSMNQYGFAKNCKHRGRQPKKLHSWVPELVSSVCSISFSLSLLVVPISIPGYTESLSNMIIKFCNQNALIRPIRMRVKMRYRSVDGCHFFLTSYFNREDNISQRLFFSCALSILTYHMSWFNSWGAEAMGVKFLAQGNNSNRKPWPGIEPGTLGLPGRCPGNPATASHLTALAAYGGRPINFYCPSLKAEISEIIKVFISTLQTIPTH